MSNNDSFVSSLEKVRLAGYSLIKGLFDDKSGSVYHIVAVCKNPEKWEPYRAQNYLDDCDAVALWWWYNEDLSADNDRGEMIYEEPDPDDYEDENDMPVVNTPKYELLSNTELLDMFGDLNDDCKEDVMERLDNVMNGVEQERWDAFRSDQ